MIRPPQADEPKPVLGLFSNEDDFRDHLAERMELIEHGLTLVKTEYRLDNPSGAGGRIDILARDAYDHIVCIEIKRSDNSARSTVNELSKYVTLLVDRDRVPREMIRCVVISTHWSELLLPLSYFAHSSGVDVTALQAGADDSAVVLHPIALKTLRFLPQLSPDMDLIRFDTLEAREQYVDFIKSRASRLLFVRFALLMFEPKEPRGDEAPQYPLVICVWRVPDGCDDRIEAIIGKRIGENFPYAAPGWEPEADAKDWVGDVPHDQLPAFVYDWTHGTPEKLQSLQEGNALHRIERVGDWPKFELINDDATILRAALAASPLGGSKRPNLYGYRATVTPTVSTSWKMAVDGFLAFIAFEPVWQDTASAYLDVLSDLDVNIDLRAFAKKHLTYAIHQARCHDDTMLSDFEIVVRADDAVIGGLHGYYTWDGETCPIDAEATITQIYGDIAWANISLGSAVDDSRYEQAHTLHGFLPVIDWLDEAGSIVGGPPAFRLTIQDFLAANPAYCRQVSEILERMGPLPTDPSA